MNKAREIKGIDGVDYEYITRPRNVRHKVLPPECQERLKEALQAGEPLSLKRHVAINAAIDWCAQWYPHLVRKI